MPELPEVETVRRGLAATLVGRTFTDARVTGTRSIRRQAPAEFIERLVGKAATGSERRGKFFLVELGPSEVLVGHLRMSGQLRWCAPGDAVAPHTHVTLSLDNGRELRFIDPRTFGELFVTDELDDRGVPVALSGLGPDPLVDGLDAADLARRVGARRSAIKTVLLDQHVVAGIGSLYADEICFAAGIRPGRVAATLDANEYDALVKATAAVLGEAVACRGSSLADERYCDLFGDLGSFQQHHAVYARAGQPCLRCGEPVVRERLAGRSAHFCPTCQA